MTPLFLFLAYELIKIKTWNYMLLIATRMSACTFKRFLDFVLIGNER